MFWIKKPKSHLRGISYSLEEMKIADPVTSLPSIA
jgi:hypothetical protein